MRSTISVDRLLPTLLETAVQAYDSPSLQRSLLVGVQQAVPFDHAFCLPAQWGPAKALAGGLITAEQGDASVAPVIQGALPSLAIELAPVKESARAQRGVAVDVDVLGQKRLERSRYYRDVLAPIGGRASMLCFPVVQGRVVGALGLVRRGRFRRSDQQRLERLLPAVALCLAASARVSFYSTAIGTTLTKREHDILDYLCLGYTNREIAAACGSSGNTVRNQLARLFEKLGATTRSELVAIALGSGLLRRPGAPARAR